MDFKSISDILCDDISIFEIKWLNNILWKRKTAFCNFIDLGLPSGTLWGDRNAGAETESEPGYHLAWGEKTCYYEEINPIGGTFVWKSAYPSGYNNQSYKYYSDSAYTKYNASDNIKVLQPEDDISKDLYGNSCSLPTTAQWRELLTQCSYSRVNNGYEITGPNGNRIFIPVNGLVDQKTIYNYNDFGGYYWTNELGSDISQANTFHFGGISDFYYSPYARYDGLGIRAIKNPKMAVNLLKPASSANWNTVNLYNPIDNPYGRSLPTEDNKFSGLETSASNANVEGYYLSKSAVHLINGHTYYLRWTVISATTSYNSITYDCYWPISEPSVVRKSNELRVADTRGKSATASSALTLPCLDNNTYQMNSLIVTMPDATGDYIIRFDVNNNKNAFQTNFCCPMLIDLTSTYIEAGLSVPSFSQLNVRNYFDGAIIVDNWN